MKRRFIGIILANSIGFAAYAADPFELLDFSTATPADANLIFLGGLHGKDGNDWKDLDAMTVEKVRELRRDRQVLLMHETLGDYPYLKKFLKKMGFTSDEVKNIDIVGIDNYALVQISNALKSKWRVGVLSPELHYTGKIRSFFMAQVIVKARNQYPNHLIVIEGGASHIIDGVIAAVLKESSISAAYLYDRSRISDEEIKDVSKPYLWRSLAEARIASRIIDLQVNKIAERIKGDLSNRYYVINDAETYLESCKACRCFLTSGWDEYAAALLNL